MKLLIRSMFVAAALVGVASADTPGPKAPPTETKDKPKAPPPQPVRQEVSAAEAEKFLAFFNKVVDAMVADKDDCAKMTKDVNAIIDVNVELVKKMQEAKAAKKDLPADAKQKMFSRLKEMKPALDKCGQDPGFNAAMMRVNNKPSAPPPAKEAPKDTKTPPKK